MMFVAKHPCDELLAFERNVKRQIDHKPNPIELSPQNNVICKKWNRGRSSCNDPECTKVHSKGAKPRNLNLCKYAVADMKLSKTQCVEYDPDNVAVRKCAFGSCPLQHYCYTCVYAPRCTCVMPHVHHIRSSTGKLLQSIPNPAFERERLSRQCNNRLNVAVDVIQGCVDPTFNFHYFCESCKQQMMIHYDALVNMNGRQPNEKLGLVWHIMKPILDGCVSCRDKFDSIECDKSPLCPNNAISIYDIMEKFILNSMSGDSTPMSNALASIFDWDDENDVKAKQLDRIKTDVMSRHEKGVLCGICPGNLMNQCYDDNCALTHMVDHAYQYGDMNRNKRIAHIFGGNDFVDFVIDIFDAFM